MNQIFGFPSTAQGAVQFFKVIAYFARFNFLYKDFGNIVCPVCGYKFQLYYHRGKGNNQFVFKCKRVGSGHMRSRTILGNGPSWFARTQLELFCFCCYSLGFLQVPKMDYSK